MDFFCFVYDLLNLLLSLLYMGNCFTTLWDCDWEQTYLGK